MGGLTSVEIKRRATPAPRATTSSPTCLKQAVSRRKDIPASPDPPGECAALAISELIIRPPPLHPSLILTPLVSHTISRLLLRPRYSRRVVLFFFNLISPLFGARAAPSLCIIQFHFKCVGGSGREKTLFSILKPRVADTLQYYNTANLLFLSPSRGGVRTGARSLIKQEM